MSPGKAEIHAQKLAPDRPSPGGRLHPLATLFVAACAGFVLLHVGARALYGIGGGLPPAVQDGIDELLRRSVGNMLLVLTRFAWNGLAPLVLLALLLVRRQWVVRRVGGRYGLRSAWHAAFWLQLAGAEIFFDMNAWIAGVAWTALPALALLTFLGTRALPRRAAFAAAACLWLAVFIAAATTAPSQADAIAVFLFGVATFAVLTAGRVLLWPDRLLLCAILIPGVQILAASRDIAILAVASACLALVLASGAAAVARLRSRGVRPRLAAIFVPLALLPAALSVGALMLGAFDLGARKLGDGLAYSFCELSERGRIYAAVPRCATGSPACIEGIIAEYDASDLSEVGRHRFFDERFYGRLEQVTCLEETLEVGMCCTLGMGIDDEGTVRWDPDEPDRYERNPPEATARRLVFDRTRDAIFYVGNDVLRLDRRTGATTRTASHLETVDSAEELPKPAFGVYIAEAASLHSSRDSLFIAEFLRGTTIYELGLDVLEVRSRIPSRNGGVIGVAADEELDRLYVAGLFGVDVWDLAGPRLVARRRTGTLARTPVLDALRGLVYVPTTIEGRIHVFDRRDFRPLGAIPIGMQTRNAYLTRDGRWLLASDGNAHYAFDAEALAARFRR